MSRVCCRKDQHNSWEIAQPPECLDISDYELVIYNSPRERGKKLFNFLLLHEITTRITMPRERCKSNKQSWARFVCDITRSFKLLIFPFLGYVRRTFLLFLFASIFHQYSLADFNYTKFLHVESLGDFSLFHTRCSPPIISARNQLSPSSSLRERLLLTWEENQGGYLTCECRRSNQWIS